MPFIAKIQFPHWALNNFYLAKSRKLISETLVKYQIKSHTVNSENFARVLIFENKTLENADQTAV